MALNARALILEHSVPYAVDTPPCNFYKYATTDAVATVIAAGYFNQTFQTLRVNDVIDAMCVMGGTADRVGLIVTAVPAGGNVTVAVNTDASGA